MRNDFETGYLEHSLFKRGAKLGSTWKNHKYVMRIKVGKNAYKYFYSMSEYMAYLNTKKNQLIDKAKNNLKKGQRKIEKLLDTKKNKSIKKDLSAQQLRKEQLNKQNQKTVKQRESKKQKELSTVSMKEKKYVHGNIKKDIVAVKQLKEKIEKAKKLFCRDSKDSHKENYEEHTNLKIKDKALTRDEDQKAVNPYLKPTKEAYNKIKAEYDAASPEGKAKLEDKLQKAYSDYKGWSQNCADCMLTYDLRRRGYDVQAARQTHGEGWTDSEIFANYKGDLASEEKWANASRTTTEKGLFGLDKTVYKNTNGHRYPAFDASEIAQIERDMLNEYPEGSYGYLNCNWQSGGSHAEIWSIENGQVVIRDPQTNEKTTLEHELLKSCSYGRVRLDDKELTDQAYEYAEAEVLQGEKIIKKKTGG